MPDKVVKLNPNDNRCYTPEDILEMALAALRSGEEVSERCVVVLDASCYQAGFHNTLEVCGFLQHEITNKLLES